jgi:uncharacterized membrane protein
MGDWHDMDGTDWLLMSLWMALSLVALAIVVWALIGLAGRANRPPSDPLDELDRRLARGEIDVPEYEERRRALRAGRS